MYTNTDDALPVVMYLKAGTHHFFFGTLIVHPHAVVLKKCPEIL